MNDSKDSPITIDIIENLLKVRYEGLQKDPKIITSEFNNTEQTKDSYNGRIILEMLQNADDARANSLKIEINYKDKLLIFSNDGDKPFSKAGFDSLLHANLSSKSNEKYNIGQKGLGIRSLLNLSKNIKIFSNGIYWSYSEEYRKDFIYKMEKLDRDNGENRFLEWKEGTPNYLEQIPLFLVPRYDVCDKNEKYTTKIELENLSEESLTQIENEIKKLKANVLLFLKNIKCIYINKNGDYLNFEIEKKEHNISILHESNSNGESKKSEWIIYKNSEIDFNGKEKLEIGVAYPIDGNLPQEERRIYSYLPTGIYLDLPLIIHARFSLSADRNNLNNDSEGRNKYLIEELVKLISQAAIYRAKSNRECDWKPYEMLALNDKKKDNPILEELGFYRKLEKYLRTSKIYPCLDNTYRTEGEFVNYGNDLSIFLKEKNLGNFYPEQIKPYPSNIDISSWEEPEYRIFMEKINRIAYKIDKASVISELIYILIKGNNIPKFSNYDCVYEILKDYNGRIITPTDCMKIFTSKSESGAPIEIPSYAESYIKFIDPEINRCLIEQFLIKERNPNRLLSLELRKLFGKFVFEYDRSNIPENLISIAVKQIESESDFSCKTKILGEMYDYLYKNCRESLSEISSLRTQWPAIPAMSKANTIVDNIDELFIPEEYPIASYEGRIFGNSRGAEKYFKLPDRCDLINEDKKVIGSFLSDLGANVYVKLIKEKKDSEITYEEYGKFLKNELKLDERLKVSNKGLSNIYNISEILELDPDKFLLLCLKSNKISELLDNNSKDCIFLMGPKMGHRGWVTDSHSSYLKFLLCKNGPFHDYILNPVYNKFNNINLNEEILNENSNRVKEILLKLGAVNDISDLSMERIKEIIIDLPKSSPDGKNVQHIYFEAVKAFIKTGKENANTLSDIDGLRLFTKSKEYVDRKCIYLGRGTIPKSLEKQKYILDFPSRGLSKENVLSFFDISELNKNEIEIIGNTSSFSDVSFANKIEELKPFMLAFRLKGQDLAVTTKENSVNNIKNFNLIIVDNGLKYKLGDKFFFMEEGDVIEDSGKKIFYLSTSNREKVSDSDLSIALYEVYNSIFNLSSDEDESVVFEKFITSHDWVSEKYSTELEEAYKLLEKDDKRQNILYKKLFDKIKDKEDSEFLNTQLCNVNRSPRDLNKVVEMLNLYWISIEDFNELSQNKLSLEDYHRQNFGEIVMKNFSTAKKIIWYRAGKNIELQKNFKADLDRYRNLFMKLPENEIKSKLVIDYNSYFFSLFKQEFGVDFLLPSEFIDIDIEKLYYDNREKSTGLNENRLDYEKKSLLFFKPINLEILSDNDLDDFVGNKISCLPLEEATFKSYPIIPLQRNHFRKLGNASYNDHKKKEEGYKAEKIALDSYKRKYPDGDVKLHSSNAADGCDGLGYDITYIDKDRNLHYVEVKKYNISDRYIFISNNEKESALRLPRYEIALVSDSKIYVINDLFNFSDGESFEKNSKFIAKVEKWKLYLSDLCDTSRI